MAGPWNLNGPAVDFSPLGNLYASFMGAYDHARKQKQEDEAGPLLEKLLAAQATGAQAQPGSLSALAAQTQGGAAGAAPKLPTFAGGNLPYANAIASVESGGKYDAMGPATRTGDRAFGKYQVMGANIPSWTKEALGREMTPQEFLANPQAQDAVFNHKFGSYVQKYGNPQDAASAWFSGRPMARAGNAADVTGTTVPSYVAKFNRALGAPVDPNSPPIQTAGAGMDLPPEANVPLPPQRPAPMQVAQNMPTQNPNGGDPTNGFNTPISQNVYGQGFNAPTDTRVPLGPQGGAPSAPATMTAQAQSPDPRADLPSQNATEAQFYMPGSGGPAPAPRPPAPVSAPPAPVPAQPAGLPAAASATGGGLTPELRTALAAGLRNPNTRAAALQMWQQIVTPGSQFDFQVVGDQLYRTNKRTGQIEPVQGVTKPAAPVSVAEGSRLVDPASGRIVFDGGPKNEDSSVYKDYLKAKRENYPGTFVDYQADIAEGKRTNLGSQISQRKAAAAEIGITPDDPRYKAFLATGDMPKESQQQLTASDKQAILQADEQVMTTESVIKNLQDAKNLSKNALGGFGASTIGKIGSVLGNQTATNTVEMENLVTSNALQQMKSIFGGNPTEGERAILLQIQGAAGQPDNVRQKIFDRAIDLATKRLEFNRSRAKEMRGGDYYKPKDAGAGTTPRTPDTGVRGGGAPPPGAKQAPDGNFYVPDPNRPGKFLMWQP